MNKQGQVEAMAVLGCVRNPKAHTAEECAKCDFKQGMCNAYRHAEALYNAGYRKIPEGTLVLTKEELVKTIESGYVYDTTSGNKINIIEMAREIARKESVKEFAEKLKKYLYNSYNLYEDISYEEFCKANVIFGDIDKLLEEYEVKE